MSDYRDYLRGTGTLKNRDVDRWVDKMEKVIDTLRQQDRIERLTELDRTIPHAKAPNKTKPA